MGGARSTGLVSDGQQSATAAAASNSGWLGVTNDPDELELLAQFQRKLQEMRAEKAMGGSPQEQPKQALPSTGLTLTPSGDGKLALTPKPRQVEVKKEEPHAPEAEVKSEIPDDDEDGLCDYAKAGINAMQARKAEQVAAATALKTASRFSQEGRAKQG